jgi:type VI secretion system protein ImpC
VTNLDVEARRSAVLLDEPEPVDYLVIGDFGSAPKNPGAALLIDRDNFDEVLAKFGLNLSGADFRQLEDYHPDRLYERLDWFREFRETGHGAKPARDQNTAEIPAVSLEELLKPSSLLDQIIEESQGGEGSKSGVEGSDDPFQRYLRELAKAGAAEPPPGAVNQSAQAAKLTETMRAVLHHPRFQTIEAAWRGLHFVLRQCDTEEDRLARIRIAHFPKHHALGDVNNAENLSRTRMFTLLNGRKWRAVIGLYSLGANAADIEFLGRMALLAANAKAPFIAEGSAGMGSAEMAGPWNELTGIPEASYVGLALPRFLLRLPYGAGSSSTDAFAFEEMPAGAPVHAHYLWGNPALACLALLIAANATGTECLELEGLPIHTYKHEGEWKSTSCAEIWMSEEEAHALMELGLMPLISYKDSGRLRLAGFRAMNGKPLRFSD